MPAVDWRIVARLAIKELRSLKADPVLLLLILYTFTYAVYAVATGAKFEVEHAAVAIVDEDGSSLSRRIRDAILPPLFKPPVAIAASDVIPATQAGRFVFVVEIPPHFERDLRAGRQPQIQLDIDATAMSLAGNGAVDLQEIIINEVQQVIGAGDSMPVELVLRARFNPNLESHWFTSVMQVINNVTMLTVILTGAALIREREHGTIEHLLVMPVKPVEIVLSKILANGSLIVVASVLSLWLVVEHLLHVPIHGSLALFVAGAFINEFSVAALGILLATFTSTMGQFGLLVMPVLIVMNLLSGSTTPLESMPSALQTVMHVSPSLHFVGFAQAVLYRAAGLEIVWPKLLWLAALGGVYLGVALWRFRRAIVRSGAN